MATCSGWLFTPSSVCVFMVSRYWVLFKSLTLTLWKTDCEWCLLEQTPLPAVAICSSLNIPEGGGREQIHTGQISVIENSGEHWETPSHTLTALQRNSLTVWHMYFLFHSVWLSSYVSRQWVHVLWVFPALLLHINTKLIHHVHSGSQVKEEPLKAIVCAVNWCKIIKGDLCQCHGEYHSIVELLGL